MNAYDLECGCRLYLDIDGAGVCDQCALHAAAPQLKVALSNLLKATSVTHPNHVPRGSYPGLSSAMVSGREALGAANLYNPDSAVPVKEAFGNPSTAVDIGAAAARVRRVLSRPESAGEPHAATEKPDRYFRPGELFFNS